MQKTDWYSKLACPRCHGPLEYVEHGGERLLCHGCKTVWPMLGGIPCLMTITEAYIDEIRRYNEIADRGLHDYRGFHDTRPWVRACLVREELRAHGVTEYVEVGSGFGCLVDLSWDFEVIAVDEAISLLQYIQAGNKAVHCVNALAEALPFPDASVPCLVSESTFQSIVDRRAFLVEVERVMAPGSFLLLTIAYEWNYPRKDQDGFDITKPEEFEALRIAIANAGFLLVHRWLDVANVRWVATKEEGTYLWILGRKAS